MVSTRSGAQVRALPHRRPARSPARARPGPPAREKDAAPPPFHETACGLLLVVLSIGLSIFICQQQQADEAVVAIPAPAWKLRPFWPLLSS